MPARGIIELSSLTSEKGPAIVAGMTVPIISGMSATPDMLAERPITPSR